MKLIFYAIVMSFLLTTNALSATKINQVKENFKKYTGWAITIEGRIYKSDFYYNKKLKDRFKSFKIEDSSGTAYVYVRKANSLGIENVIKKYGNGCRGKFHTRIPRSFCKENYKYLCTELEGWKIKK